MMLKQSFGPKISSKGQYTIPIALSWRRQLFDRMSFVGASRRALTRVQW
jgi:hypothetical protein